MKSSGRRSAVAGKKKPIIQLAHGAVDETAAVAFIATGKADRPRGDSMPTHHDAKASKHRTMIYLEKTLFRRLKVRCAETDEPMTLFVERAVRELLERETGGKS